MAALPALAGLLVVAGAAKAARPDDTARALVQLLTGSPRVAARRLALGRWGVRLGAVAEAAIGTWVLVAGGRWAAALLAASYGCFAVFVGTALVGDRPLATCGCFGEPDTPPTRAHAALCAAGAVVAAGAALHGPVPALPSTLSRLGGEGGAFLALSGVLAYGAYLVMAARPRVAAASRLLRTPLQRAPLQRGGQR